MGHTTSGMDLPYLADLDDEAGSDYLSDVCVCVFFFFDMFLIPYTLIKLFKFGRGSQALHTWYVVVCGKDLLRN